MSHDLLFKSLLNLFFIEFLQLFFPQVVAYIDPGSIEFLETEIFTEFSRKGRKSVDLLAKVRGA